MASLGNLSVSTRIFEVLADVGYVSAPILEPRLKKSSQHINRCLRELEESDRLKCLGKLGTSKIYVGMRSNKTLEDVEKLNRTRELKPTAWMGQDLSPTVYIELLHPDKQKTAQKLLDEDAPGYVDFFNQILPAMELICFGRRASRQVEIDAAYALVGQYADNVNKFATFLRMFCDNEHIRSGRFADDLSDYTVNNFRSAYTRESA